MKKATYKLESKVVLYPGMAGWHFIGVDKKTSTEIKDKHGANRKGFGSIPVTVTVGKTSWDTSIFPDKKSGMYLLPLKAAVRKKEGIFDGDTVQFSIRVR